MFWIFNSSCICLLQVASLETVLGTEQYWAMMLSLSLIPALAQYLVLPFCPESPRYLLITRGEESNAKAGGSHGVLTANMKMHLCTETAFTMMF